MQPSSLALAIASLSLLIAGLSLGWQVALYLLSGGRPKAELMHGLLKTGGGAFVAPVAAKAGSLDIDKMRRRSGLSGTEVLGIRVTNRGRASITVDRIAVCLRGGVMTYLPVGDAHGPELPHRLDPGTNGTWVIDLDLAKRLASTSREVLNESIKGAYMTAQTGVGKTIQTSETLAL